MVTVKSSFHDVASWLDLQSQAFSATEVATFEKAIKIAEVYYQGKKFEPTDVSLLNNALTCAAMVAELHLYADAVVATLLCDIPKHCNNWVDELSGFDKTVIELVDGINRVHQIRKIGEFDLGVNEEEKKDQVEVIRKMLLAMVSDIRAVLIVLVRRGELMLHLNKDGDLELNHKIALETMEIFAPLANRLGMWQIKWELEDLSFKYLHHDEYKRIAKLLDEKRQERLDYIEHLKEYLSGQMEESGITHYQVSGRAKHIYSIWKKMKKKNYDFSGLYDIRAVRILVPEIRDCYTVLGIVHTKYSPVPGEFDDYISNPKPNNYQSLHTCVLGPNNKTVEVQIRTFAMHDHAEYGVAAHWRYKEGGENNPKFEEKIAWIRQILDWRDELTEHKDLTDIFKNEIFSDSIYVMTPTGKVITLPSGATPIDFAYAVHSSVGDRCRGAKVDGHIVPLSTALQNGQRIEVITIKEGGPSINWLHEGWVKSSKAIGHIRRYIRNQHNEDFFESGREVFERELSKVPASIRPKPEDIVQKLNHTNERDLQISIGKGDLLPIDLRAAMDALIQEATPQPREELTAAEFEKKLQEKQEKAQNNKNKVKPDSILVDGVSGIVTHMAKCCKPIPGDNIVGFITQGNGVAVHRIGCNEFNNQAKNHPHKMVKVEWGAAAKTSTFNADVEIVANDRHGLLRDLTDLFAMEKLNIFGLRTVCRNNKAIMTFTVNVSGNEFNFNNLFSKLFNIEGVTDVDRK
ncbi:MAG: bifunctional (p)ppGpp synthetase/guanosine-3',5'-bis(diphosphate) 3'-pyrophosphohydrolase [Burkholderiales bacterium]|nr:bifunctional (p)ppGpp synthetase/guanosine-3',5'-bis(diphosphate) 3'-pyrophosphohydrolase [Burkholderiales bacterium]